MSMEKGSKLKNSNVLPTILFMILGGTCGLFGIRIIDSRLGIMGGPRSGVEGD